MDMIRGIPLPEQKDAEIQKSSWIPVTPAKPIPSNRPVALGSSSSSSSQGNQAGASSCIGVPQSGDSPEVFHPYRFFQDGASQGGSPPNPMGYATDRLQDLISNEAAAVLACELHHRPRPCSNVHELSAQAIRNCIHGWSQIQCGSLLAFTDAASSSNSKTSLPPNTPYMFAPPEEQSGSQDQLLLNGKVLLRGGNMNIINGNHLPRIPQHGFPVPFHSIHDPDASSSPLAPVTPDKCNRIQVDAQSLIDDTETVERGKEKNGSTLPPLASTGKKSIQICFDQGISMPNNDPYSMRLSSFQENNQKHDKGEEIQGIDLNRTPPQKPRRKKHRPKVIREGKPARKPKPVIPKPASNKESPSGKRRYTRKKGLSSLENPLGRTEGETINPDVRSGQKSVRRNLNFDLEDCQARDECMGSNMAINNNTESQARDERLTGNSTSSSAKSSVQLIQGVEVVVENTPPEIVFDLNYCCIDQMLDDYISLPENPSPTPQLSRRETLKGNLKALAQKRDTESTSNSESLMPCRSPSGDQSTPQDQQASDYASNLLLSSESVRNKASKTDCSLTTNGFQLCYSGMVPANIKYTQPCNELDRASQYHKDRFVSYFPQIHKKRRTEKGQNQHTSNNASSSFMQPRSKGAEHNFSMRNNSKEVFWFADAQKLMALEKHRTMEGGLAFGQLEMTKKKRSKAPIRVRNFNNLIATVECKQPLTPKNPLAFDVTQGSGPQACLEALVADTHAKMKTKRRSTKRQTSEVTPKSSNANHACLQENDAVACSIQQKSVESIVALAGNFQQKKTHILQNDRTQNCQSHYIFQESPHASIVSREMVPYVDPLDAIVQKLKCLDINGGHENATILSQNSLVPYIGDGKIIPFEGAWDHIRKRKPRAKVDLDLETNRVWKLLMGKEVSDGGEEVSVDKEKWWEEERKVFRGRVDSFIARMHLVQGDRRFSQWKGSVVDSVVGVFLTQNVSDHLSSSAYMSLAARFPPRSRGNNRAPNSVKESESTDQQEVCILDFEDTMKWQQVSDQGSVVLHEHEAEHMEEKEMASKNQSLGNKTGGGIAGYSKGKDLEICGKEIEAGLNSPQNKSETSMTVTGGTVLADAEDRGSLEDAFSSQNSVVSSQNSSDFPIQTADRIGSSSESNSETEDLITVNQFNGASTSFMELLKMAGSNMFQEFCTRENKMLPFQENCHNANYEMACKEGEKNKSSSDQVGKFNIKKTFLCASNSHQYHKQHDLTGASCGDSAAHHLQNTPNSGFVGLEKVEALREESRCFLPSIASGITDTSDLKILDSIGGPSAENSSEVTGPPKLLLDAQDANACDSYAPESRLASISRLPVQPLLCSVPKAYGEKHSYCHTDPLRERIQVSSDNNTSLKCLMSQDEHKTRFQQKEREAGSQVKPVEALDKIRNCGVHQPFSESTIDLRGPLEVLNYSSVVEDKNDTRGKAVESNSNDQVRSSGKVSKEQPNSALKRKKQNAEKEKKKAIDWDSLRRQTGHNVAEKERSSDTMDSLDWEAVRSADVSEIANTIRERGMNNMLAERIKAFLNRLIDDHGSIDLEWLRDVPPDKAKDYLLSIRGLGLKSVECVRLLTLHHLAFPVDTNVGRICVRLGWVPLQPLPESLQLHLLEMYPILETIQKYLWPRLCTLDQRTLYELHYQMITFGKVFCTKSKPNCNACPMRGECKHFASAFASARLALPGPEDKSLVSSDIRYETQGNHKSVNNPIPLPQLEGNSLSQGSVINKCEPIIEEPPSPEPEYIETSESAIEDAFYEDPDEIPTIKLNFQEFTQNLQTYMQENNMELQDVDMSKALVALTPEVASIPMPKLKNVSRLRTEHQVYELPDSHPLLEGLDQREPDDPSHYLLAIWTPGETAQSIEPPEICCNSQDTDSLCDKLTCFACNSIREARAQTVRGTLLVPCRTAMRGSFPLNGTYFQVNEVFADHASSLNPIDVPREWIWSLPRRTVYFGTSIPTIFKGLTTEGIQHCFWRGFVCVRGFDQVTRAPRPLIARLHFPASRLTRNKMTATPIPTPTNGARETGNQKATE